MINWGVLGLGNISCDQFTKEKTLTDTLYKLELKDILTLHGRKHIIAE